MSGLEICKASSIALRRPINPAPAVKSAEELRTRRAACNSIQSLPTNFAFEAGPSKRFRQQFSASLVLDPLSWGANETLRGQPPISDRKLAGREFLNFDPPRPKSLAALRALDSRSALLGRLCGACSRREPRSAARALW